MTATLSHEPRFELATAETWPNPWPMYRALRDHDPVHTEFRKLVSRGFTPRQVEAVEPKVREFVVERIERLRANGGGDIVAELFKPLPSMVVAHYLGVPEEDRVQFDGWTDAIVAANTA